MRELSIFAAAEDTPHRDCVVEGDRTHSFSDIAARVAAAVERLEQQGVECRSLLAVTPRADLDTVIWLFALFETGVPALLLHPRLSESEREAVLDTAERPRVLDEKPPTDTASSARPRDIPRESTLAIVYTSGTTGLPRGAVLSRRSFVASARAHAENLGWQEGDRWLLTMPPAHIGGLSILTRCLIARRCVVLAPGRFDAHELARVMSSHRATLLSVVPTMLQRLVDLSWRPHPELRAVLVGGAAFPESLRKRAVDLGIPALGTYGCTEACSQIATQRFDQLGTSGSGAPLEGIEVRIRSSEIQVRGEVLMDGYLGEARRPDDWTDDGWLRTSDLGKLHSDGQLHVLGRRDDVIITGGENVAPLEVEAWLESMPGVVSACVFGIPDDEWGQVVAGALVVEPDVFEKRVLQARIRGELAAHKRLRRVALVEALELTKAGKIDRIATAREARRLLQPI